MNALEILLWSNAIWCFRGQFDKGFLGDDSYRVIEPHTPEWYEHLQRRRQSVSPS